MDHFKQFIVFLLTLFTISIPCSLRGDEVEQKGFVRTAGRPGCVEGKRLGQVIIRVRGQHNAVLSDQNGDFSLIFSDSRSGYAEYSLSGVQLRGYELLEKELLHRRLALSSTIPLEIVMVSLQEKQKIEIRLRNTIEKQYRQKLLELEAQVRQMGEESYRQAYSELQNQFERRESIVKDLVERYARMDYAVMSEIEMKISSCIESGDLEKADSLIQTLDFQNLERSRNELGSHLDSQRSALEEERNSLVEIEKKLRIGYRGKFELSYLRMDMEQAALYLEKEVALDTADAPTLRKAAIFYSSTVIDMEKSKRYLSAARRAYERKYGPYSPEIIELLNVEAATLYRISEYHSALSLMNEAIEIQKHLPEPDYGKLISSLIVMSDIYKRNDFNEEARHSIETAEFVYQYVPEYQKHVAYLIFSAKGLLAEKTGNYQEAIENYFKAYEILETYGSHGYSPAPVYRNLARVFGYLGDRQSQREYLEHALEVDLMIYPEGNPEVVMDHINLASQVYQYSDPSKALEYLNKALELTLDLFGEHCELAGDIYNNLGGIYVMYSDLDTAMEYFEKAYEVKVSLFGPQNGKLMTTYRNVAYVYFLKEDFKNAFDYYQAAYNISVLAFGEFTDQAMNCLGDMAAAKFEMGKLDESRTYLQQALEIAERIYYPEHPSIGRIYVNFGDLEHEVGNFGAAENYFQNGLNILLRVEEAALDRHVITESCKMYADLLHDMKEYEAEEYFRNFPVDQWRNENLNKTE